MMSNLYTITCKKAGCGYVGPADVVVRHLDGRSKFRCPQCNSTNVKVLQLSAPNGERLPAISLPRMTGRASVR